MNKLQVVGQKHNVSFVTLTRLARCMGCKGTGDKGQHTTSPNILSLCPLSHGALRLSGSVWGGGDGGLMVVGGRGLVLRHRRSGVSPVGGSEGAGLPARCLVWGSGTSTR
jgi:hypothetical protein